MAQSSSAAYSPNAAQPYQAYVPPETAAPTPSPVEPQGQKPFQFTGAPITHLGAVAGVMDNILRGYMQGRAQGEQIKAMRLKRQSDNLRASYNQDAKMLYDLAQSGVSKESPEFQHAVSAVQGSWGALQQFIGQHIENGDTGGKKKKKPKDGQQADVLSNPLEDLKSSDPNTKAKAIYQLSQKFGPPVMAQISTFYTPQAQAARKAGELGTQNVLTKEQAQQTYDQLAGKYTGIQSPEDIARLPKDQQADAQKYLNAKEVLYPPKNTGPAYLYKDPDGVYRRHRLDEVPEGSEAVPPGATKPYKMTDGSIENFVPGMQPEGATAVVTSGAGAHPKIGTFGDFVTRLYGDNPTPKDEEEARRMWAHSGHVAGAGGAGGNEEKAYQKWYHYYKEHYPELTDEEADARARRKLEGQSQMQAGQIAHDAVTEPKQFDGDVIGMAIDNLRKEPQWTTAKNANGDPLNLDDALANVVGLGDDGYQYHTEAQLGKPNGHGLYSGAVKGDQLKALERDLQTNIRIILSKQTALPPDQRRLAAKRLAPLFGPAVQGRGNSPASPQAPAAAPAAAASSPSPRGGKFTVIDPNGHPHPFDTQQEADEFKRLAHIK